MGTVAKPSTGGDYRPAPEGSHAAVCGGVFDLGHQWKQYDAGDWKHEVRLNFELSNEAMDDGRPFTVGRTFTLSLNEKSNLFKFLRGWGLKPADLGTGRYDVAERLGKPCMLTVSHSEDSQGRTWANVEAAAPLPKGFPSPTPANELVYYSTDNGPPGPDVPERIAEKIRQCQEFGGQPQDGRAQAAPQSAPRRGPGPATPMGVGSRVEPVTAVTTAGAPVVDDDDEIPF
jgi:hypothetical protein